MRDWTNIGMVVALIAATAVLIIMGVGEAHSPVLATLKKTEWRCDASHEEGHLRQIGKNLIPTRTKVCDRYVRLHSLAE